MNQHDKAELFFELHQKGAPFILPNPWDAGSARMLAAKGFPALATTSVGVDHVMGKPGGSAGIDDILENARLIAGATDLPVSVDLEDCYGATTSQIADTIRRAADAGAVGGSIEDAIWGAGGAIYDFDTAVARVEAAANAAAALPFKFTLTARCENFLFGNPDLDDTLRRLDAYSDAGADVLYAPGLTSADEIAAVVANVDKPVNVLLGMANTRLTMADMHRLGVARVSLGSGLHRAAMTAFLNAVDEIQSTGTFSFTGGVKSMQEIDDLLG